MSPIRLSVINSDRWYESLCPEKVFVFKYSTRTHTFLL